MTMSAGAIHGIGREAAPSRAFLEEGGALIRLTLPMTATALVNMGMSITDVVMMGRFGPNSVAAGAIVSDLYSIVYYLGAGALAAVGPEIAQAIGGARRHAVRQAAQQSLWMAAIFAGLAWALLWNTATVLGWAGIDGTVVRLSEGYARMMAVTAIPMMGVAVWRSVYAAVGEPRAFLIATIIALPANAALDYLFMFGAWGIPALGLTGAGVASVIVAAGMFAGLSINAAISGSIRGYRIMVRFRSPDPHRLGRLLRVGLPMGVSGFTEVGVFLLSTMLAGLFGAEALAAHAITLRMAGVVYALPLGLSQAATVRVGYAVGGRDGEKIARAVRAALALGLGGGSVLFLAILGGRQVIPWFFLPTGDPAAPGVASAAAALLAVLSVICLAQGLGVISAGALRGFKDTKVPMVISVFAFWGVGMSTIVLAAFAADRGVDGIWLGIAAGALCNAVLTWRRLTMQLRKDALGRQPTDATQGAQATHPATRPNNTAPP